MANLRGVKIESPGLADGLADGSGSRSASPRAGADSDGPVRKVTIRELTLDAIRIAEESRDTATARAAKATDPEIIELGRAAARVRRHDVIAICLRAMTGIIPERAWGPMTLAERRAVGPMSEDKARRWCAQALLRLREHGDHFGDLVVAGPAVSVRAVLASATGGYAVSGERKPA